MSALVVLRPCQDEGLRDVGTRDHEEGSEVEDAGERHWDSHNDDVAYHADYCAEDAPAVAVLVVVCQVGANHGECECAGVGSN